MTHPTMRVMTFGLGVCAAALALLGPSTARALSCDDIVNLVTVNVPTSIVIQTIKDSGESFSDEDIACLEKANVPPEVLTQAQDMSAAKAAQQSAAATIDENPAPAPSALSQDTDTLGTKASSKKSQVDLETPEGEEGSPTKVKDAIAQLKANRPLTASLMLFEMLDQGSYPSDEVKIDYYLAKALSDLEMYHSAQYYYIEVIKKGPGNPYFGYAIPQLVAIARITGNDLELSRLAAKIPPEAYPRSAQAQMYYLMGVRAYDQEKLADASKYFGQIGTKSELYLKSKYFEGVIANQQNKYKSAVQAFLEVYKATGFEMFDDQREVQEITTLKDLALLNVARIYYGVEQYDNAIKYYKLIGRDSDFWAESQFELAWADFMKNDLNKALGDILTVASPFYDDEKFIPEAHILRALSFFNMCQFSDVQRVLLQFEEDYKPMNDEMRTFVQSYQDQQQRELADQAWDAYFGDHTVTTTLPQSFFARVLENSDIAAIVRHMDLMDQELSLIDAQKSQWKNALAPKLKEVIEKDRQRYKKRAGLLLLSEMSNQAMHLADLLAQSEIIRFEVVDAQRIDYQYKMEKQELQDSSAKVDLDFSTSKEFIYWPFNGEFWKDELGYYQYTEQSSCK